MLTHCTLGALSLLLSLLAGCTSSSLSAQLPEAEQGVYRVYQRLMTGEQLRTYRSLPTAAERAAYARQVSAAQQLASLSEPDRTTVLYGYPAVGMSRQALLLLWGEPYRREGPAAYERWWYLGDSLSLADLATAYDDWSTVTEVALEHGRVVWWQERIPSDDRRRRFFRHLWYPAD